VSGSDVTDQLGVYGNKGESNPANVPGARRESVSWIDAGDNLWLFGGLGYDFEGSSGRLNDLWKFDGVYWIWISGSNVINQHGIQEPFPDPVNTPGARSGSASWIDSSGNLWLFGGTGYDVEASIGGLNDLWRFDGTYWMWVSGSDVIDNPGFYGYKGIPDPANMPGARSNSVSWIDGSDNLWLFGGYGRPSHGYDGRLNDLWRFDGTNWTWMAGPHQEGQPGFYGIKGVPNPGNVPGARDRSISWTDASGDFFLFGGYLHKESSPPGIPDPPMPVLHYLNDLWRFDGTNWTWVSGSYLTNQPGVYGTKGVADPANFPGARTDSISWMDNSGNLWLFGGLGYGSLGSSGALNDLWKLNFCDYAIPGDYNGDCVFNFFDFAMMAPHWLEEAWHH
jgi:hypothetical protein